MISTGKCFLCGALLLLGASGTTALADEKVPVHRAAPWAPPTMGREVIDEGVTRLAIQTAFQASDDQDRQQKLLSLLLLLSAVPDKGGRTK